MSTATATQEELAAQDSFVRRCVDARPRAEEVAELIAEVTDESPSRALERLRAEHEHPGRTVREDFERRGMQRYTWNDELVRFYEQTDAFLYELAVWHCNKIKRKMRRFVMRQLDAVERRLSVLALGDGLGFDCLAMADAGHEVTYFDVPGYTQRFAERLFSRCGVDIQVLTDPLQIRRAAYDAVVCLDVLEHVPDPPQMLREIITYLKPGGLLLAHAPFYMVLPDYPTHLASNRRYAGSLKIYREAGLQLIDGDRAMNPLVLAKGEPAFGPLPGAARRRLTLRLYGGYFALCRWLTWPMRPLNYYRYRRRRWFDGRC